MVASGNDFHLCAEGFRNRKGGFGVPAGGIAPEFRGPFGKGGGKNGALGETFGGGHIQAGGPSKKSPISIDGLRHFGVGLLARGGGLHFGQRRIGKRSALFQTFYSGRTPRFAHGKSDQAFRSGIETVVSRVFIERKNPRAISLGTGCTYDFYNFASEAAALPNRFPERFPRGYVLEIMAGTNHRNPVFRAGAAYLLADLRRRLDFQIGIGGTGPNGSQEFLFRRLPGHFRGRGAASGDERSIGRGEQCLDVFFVKRTPVQSDFRHFKGGRGLIQRSQNFFQALVLQGDANHFKARITASGDRFWIWT